ncbi:MAG: hypothetical protein PHO37_08585, partial [Kiritimatiellae bacterium]|nr:hypothetical protein [Kiritimatiellia bacterium]
LAPMGAAAQFAPAGGDSVYGCDLLFAGSLIAPLGVVRFAGLNTNVSYTFTMYASRMGASDTRDAVYTLAGAATNSVVLDAVNNDSNVVIIPNVYADVNGVVDFSMVSGPNNNNDYKFFYISAMKIEYIPAEVEPPPAGSSKNLLFFGNSFSQGSYVPGLVQSLAVVAGYNQPRVVADLAGGTDLAYHITRVNDYPQNNVDSSLLPAGDTWDHVIMQGYSTEATHLRDPMVFKTNAVTLYQLVKNHASGKGAGVEGVLYETWARSPKHSFYPGSFADPAAMQLEIRTNYNGAAELITAAEGASSVRIARVGSAFETSRFDPSLYASDEYHQSDLGAHLAAMVLYKTIYAQDATNLSYTAAVAANWTTMTSNQWHDLTMWADGVATSTPPPIDPPGPAVPNNNLVIYIDPHGGEAPASWNNASFVSTTVMELKNTKSNLTGITLSVTNTMQDGSTFGSAAPTSAAAEFAPAGNTGAYGNNGNPNCDVLFTGMTPGRVYWFTFYNSRMAATDNRGTAYRLTGATQVAGSLNAANNSSNVILLSVEPAADGSVLLFIEKSADNDNPDGFYYLNAMKIESYYYGTIIRFQ